jgi:uncharacterized protein (TIGR02996 family)
MDQQQALLGAILECPDDDGPRLVYADFLEEHGDAINQARAAFIRLQCEMARVDRYDARWPGLAREASAMLKHYAKRWLRRDGLHRLSEPRFQRGFIAEADFDTPGHFLQAAGSVLARTPLQGVTIQELPYEEDDEGEIDHTQLRTFLTSPHFRRLRKLAFRTVEELGEEEMGELLAAPALDGLRELDLADNSLDDETIAGLFRSPALSHLEALDLGGNSLQMGSFKALSRCRHLAGLRRLRWDRGSYGWDLGTEGRASDAIQGADQPDRARPHRPAPGRRWNAAAGPLAEPGKAPLPRLGRQTSAWTSMTPRTKRASMR